jgi:hypothetical protein
MKVTHRVQFICSSVTVVGLTDLKTMCTLQVTNMVHPASDLVGCVKDDLGVAPYERLECATMSGLGASLQDDLGRALGESALWGVNGKGGGLS